LIEQPQFSILIIPQLEIKALIKLAIAEQPKQPKFKAIVQQQLYNAGKELGQQLAAFIQQQLKSKGYF